MQAKTCKMAPLKVQKIVISPFNHRYAKISQHKLYKLHIYMFNSSPSYEVTLAEAKAAKDEGIDIVVVGIENMVSLKELQAIASGMDSTNLFTVPTVNDLSNILQKTRDAICNSKFVFNMIPFSRTSFCH